MLGELRRTGFFFQFCEASYVSFAPFASCIRSRHFLVRRISRNLSVCVRARSNAAFQ